MTDYRHALITGASSGLGRGLATWFAKQGVRVYAAARRRDLLDELRREAGDNVVPLVLDVRDADATAARVAALDAECGGLDLVIANAGRSGGTPGGRMKWATVHDMLQVNVVGALATLSGALPGMVERGRGHLVGISSLAGIIALPRVSTYSASKAFLTMWLDSIRLDVEPLGLNVTVIAPGFVKTPMTEDLRPEAMPFLLESDDACDRMAKAIVRKERRFAFPWQTSLAINSAAALMPRGLLDSLLRKFMARAPREAKRSTENT